MPTQIETIIAALEKNGEPMTASQLADTLLFCEGSIDRPDMDLQKKSKKA